MSVNIVIEAGDDLRFAPDIVRLPSKVEVPRSERSPTPLLVIPVFLFFLYQVLLAVMPAMAVTGSLLAAVVLVLAGWLWWRSNGLPHVINFDREGVDVGERHAFGMRRWRANYNEFEGVVMRDIVARSRFRQTQYEAIELKHPDPDKTLPLYVVQSRAEPRERWLALAELLGVKALQDSDVVD